MKFQKKFVSNSEDDTRKIAETFSGYIKNNSILYIEGDVGVGKTMILNFFFDLLKEKKLRLHFNEFMLSFHDFVHKKKEEENIISHFVKNLKLNASLNINFFFLEIFFLKNHFELFFDSLISYFYNKI